MNAAPRKIRTALALVAVALIVSACSGKLRSFSGLEQRPSETARINQTSIGPNDLVGADGHCAEEGGTPPGGAIGLEMSECDVVRRAGTPPSVDISANERGERTATLTYLTGPYPGIYRFVGGRLKVMERAPEPPPQPKPAKPVHKKPKPKKKPAVARKRPAPPAQTSNEPWPAPGGQQPAPAPWPPPPGGQPPPTPWPAPPSSTPPTAWPAPPSQ